ncbi:hypothetical protein [Cryobacterium sp. Y62]|uniref:hypothetical protein n=1 Tax=Cryobacterium sp. Y62 TaxID=2048284 RepID=UPI0011B03698|nr:hypothetical protein [Cryobacterium sp. Y62]
MGEMQAGQGGGFKPNSSRRVGVFMVVFGAVAAVIGFVLLLLPSGPASFGWFAYAPLSNTTFFPPGGLLSVRTQIGIVLFIVGLVLLAFGAGWMLGQRQAGRQRRLPDPSSPSS